jgi:ankyrin repeat protein
LSFVPSSDGRQAMAAVDMDEIIDDLIYAARTGDMEDLNIALNAGAPVDATDFRGTTGLMMAAANG